MRHPVVGLLGHPDRMHGLTRRLTPAQSDLHLTQLRDDLFRLGSLTYSQLHNRSRLSLKYRTRFRVADHVRVEQVGLQCDWDQIAIV